MTVGPELVTVDASTAKLEAVPSDGGGRCASTGGAAQRSPITIRRLDDIRFL
jgi:hypothetical protein